MPEITALGWFHTAVGAFAIVVGIYALIRHRHLSSTHASGRWYLGATLITAATALAIFQHGGFGPAHGLAVMTLLALMTGLIAEKTLLFGRLAAYVAAVSYLATLLFHAIPAVTDATLRLPVGNPMLTSIEDPRLKMAYLGLLLTFLVGTVLQVRWLLKRG